jgi:hypothetical protein
MVWLYSTYSLNPPKVPVFNIWIRSSFFVYEFNAKPSQIQMFSMTIGFADILPLETPVLY